MDQNRAAGPQSGTPEAFEQALKQYTQELMALYRRQRAEQQPADAGTQAAERTPEPPSPPKEEEQPSGTRPAAIREPEREPPPAEPEPHTTAGQPHTQTRLRPEPETRPAQSGSSTGEPSRPAMPGNQTGETPPAAPSAAPKDRLGRKEQNAAPDASGSPIDAIGREEATYCAGCDETLARLREGVEALGDRLREGAESLLRGRQQTGDSREDRSIWEQPAAPAYSPVTGPADSGAISEAETAAGLLPYDTTTFAGSQASGGSSSAASSGGSAGEEGPQGTIKTQVFTARRAYPVKGAQVDLYQDREGRTVLLDSQLTDQSGQTEPVTVPALNKSLSEQPGAEHPYLSYHLHISHPDFVDAVIDHVAVFEDVVSIQSVDLIPTAAAPTPTSRFIEYPTPEEELL